MPRLSRRAGRVQRRAGAGRRSRTIPRVPVLIAAVTGLVLGLAAARARPRELPRAAADLAAEGALAALLGAAATWAAGALEPQPPLAGIAFGGCAAIILAAGLHRQPLRRAAGWRPGAVAAWVGIAAALAGAGLLGGAQRP